MLIFENIMLALNGLKSNKTRSALTMLGIIIGIAAVISIMTIGNAMSNSIKEEMSSFGANQITLGVSPKDDDFGMGGMSFRGPRRDMRDEDYITTDMMEQAEEKFAGRIEGIALTENVGTGQAKDGSLYAYVSVMGTNYSNLAKEDLTMLTGRQFSDADYDDSRKVCLVSDYFVNNMFKGDTTKALGQPVSVVLNNRYYTYTIIGVYEYSDEMGSFSSTTEEDTETTLYLPLETALAQTHNKKGYASITVLAADSSDATSLTDEIQDYFNSEFYRNNDRYEISGYSMSSMIENIDKTMSSVSMAISMIAGISLLVGGIGVMNIMLVSITERTREIGTRKALGATNSSIRIQFIVESIVLCMVGGLIGIILGIIIGLLVSKAMSYSGSISILSIIVSVGFSAAIGVFFGYYPANKAAKMNPIDALRYE